MARSIYDLNLVVNADATPSTALLESFDSIAGGPVPAFVLGDTLNLRIRPVEPNPAYGNTLSSTQQAPWLDRDLTGVTMRATLWTPGEGVDSGTFTLTWGGDTTSAIAYDASAATVETELNLLASVIAAGGLTVSGDAGGPWTVRWTSNADRAEISGDATECEPLSQITTITQTAGDGSTREIQVVILERSNIGETSSFAAFAAAAVVVSETVTGSASVNERQRISLDPIPYGGTYTLTFGANTTTQLAYNANAATIQAALVALASIGAGGCSVTGLFPNFDVEFIGSKALADQALITGDASGLDVPTGFEGDFTINTAAAVKLVGNAASAAVTFEVEMTGTGSRPITLIQVSTTLYNHGLKNLPTAAQQLTPLGDLAYRGAADLLQGGSAELDGDKIDLDVAAGFANITPNTGGAEVDDVSQLGAILDGIDDALAFVPASAALLANGSVDGTGLQKLLGLEFTAPTELTIATGAITTTQSYHFIDTEADSASDDLTDITAPSNSQVLILQAANGARDVVIKHNGGTGTANILCVGNADITLDDVHDFAILIHDGSQWIAGPLGGGGGSGIASVAADTTPQHGGDWDFNAKANFHVIGNQTGGAIGTATQLTAVKHDTGSTYPNVAHADNSEGNVLGVIWGQIADTLTGNMYVGGILNGIDLSAYAAGNILYVPTTGGNALTATAPTTGFIIPMGVVVDADASGAVYLFPASYRQAVTTVATGGSGRASATAYAVICGGTTSTAAHQSIASVGSTGQLLTSNGAGALPTMQGAPEVIQIACSDETTALTTGTAKATFRMPFAMTLSAVRASVTTAPTGAILIVDINESGTTLMTTNKLSIDATEKTSTTAATAATLTDTALADDAEITIDIDQVGSSVAGAGLKVSLIGKRA